MDRAHTKIVSQLYYSSTVIVVVGSQLPLSQALKLTYYVLTTPIFMSWLLSIYYIFNMTLEKHVRTYKIKVHKIAMKVLSYVHTQVLRG